MKRLNKKGFSLVEILAVMVILGILMTTAIAVYSKYRLKAIEDSYRMMSENGATAAEEYFMDYITEDSVTFETLIEGDYFERTVDPVNKDKLCSGSVEKYSVLKGKNGALDDVTLKVIVNCEKFESCYLYPNKIECSKEDGIITNGTNQSFSLGLENMSLGNNMTLAIRVKFNDLFTNKNMEYFGNWESAGGGLGITKDSYFYFNLYPESGSSYTTFQASDVAYKDRWYVVVGVLNNGQMSMYLNGTQLKTNSGITSVTLPGAVVKQSPMPFTVGGNPEKDGKISSPAPITVSNAIIIKKALTQSDINNYFSTPSKPINYTKGDAEINKIF